MNLRITDNEWNIQCSTSGYFLPMYCNSHYNQFFWNAINPEASSMNWIYRCILFSAYVGQVTPVWGFKGVDATSMSAGTWSVLLNSFRKAAESMDSSGFCADIL
jgi:hypothetical protein